MHWRDIVEQTGSEQARKRLPELLEMAHHGEPTIVSVVSTR